MPDNIRELTPEEAQKKIRKIAKFFNIIPTDHCYERMDDRSYSIHDIELVLQKGTVHDPPEYDEVHRSWKYNVEGKAIEGDKAVVVTVILSHHDLLAITIMPKDV